MQEEAGMEDGWVDEIMQRYQIKMDDKWKTANVTEKRFIGLLL